MLFKYEAMCKECALYVPSHPDDTDDLFVLATVSCPLSLFLSVISFMDNFLRSKLFHFGQPQLASFSFTLDAAHGNYGQEELPVFSR